MKQVLYYGGAAAFVFGCWQIYHPLGPIVGGVLAVLVSLLMDRVEVAKRQNEPD